MRHEVYNFLVRAYEKAESAYWEAIPGSEEANEAEEDLKAVQRVAEKNLTGLWLERFQNGEGEVS